MIPPNLHVVDKETIGRDAMHKPSRFTPDDQVAVGDTRIGEVGKGALGRSRRLIILWIDASRKISI